MRRTFAGFVPPLLAALALLSPGRAVAGPPERVSGKMVLDKVEDGLRNYRKAKDRSSRAVRLIQLADTASDDPRVALAIGEAFADVSGSLRALAGDLACEHYLPISEAHLPGIIQWWAKNEADLRRRAAQLPR